MIRSRYLGPLRVFIVIISLSLPSLAIGQNSSGHWEKQLPHPDLIYFQDLQVLNDQTVFGTGLMRGIQDQEDGGYTWNHTLLDTSEAYTLENIEGLDFVDQSTGWVVGDDGVLLHTKNGGQKWIKQHPNTDKRLEQVDFINADTGWVVGSDQHLLQTVNGGQTWQRDTMNTQQFMYDVDFVSSGHGWAVGGRGTVYHYHNPTSTPIDKRGDLPSHKRLEQNYPNPFNPTTNIKFSLPQASNVKLTVYDLMGRRVATLIDGQRRAGQHSVTFDGSNLSSGVYLYRLETNTSSQAKKMLLVK